MKSSNGKRCRPALTPCSPDWTRMTVYSSARLTQERTSSHEKVKILMSVYNAQHAMRIYKLYEKFGGHELK
jgi:hypothetical protein